jgi:DNA-cytosine methyltransferase
MNPTSKNKNSYLCIRILQKYKNMNEPQQPQQKTKANNKQACAQMTRQTPHLAAAVCYRDIRVRDISLVPPCQVYIAGSPCQSYSGLGLQEGDEADNGQLVWEPVRYVAAHKPAAVILENVALFSTKFADVMELLLESLRQLSYTVRWAILDTKDFGIPQSRSRFYLVAIRNDCLRVERTGSVTLETIFPEPMGFTIPLSALIDPLPEGAWQPAPPESDDLARSNVLQYYTKMGAKGLNPFLTHAIIDAGSSRKFSSGMTDLCPCLTRNRAREQKYWSSYKGGSLSFVFCLITIISFR